MSPVTSFYVVFILFTLAANIAAAMSGTTIPVNSLRVLVASMNLLAAMAITQMLPPDRPLLCALMCAALIAYFLVNSVLTLACWRALWTIR